MRVSALRPNAATKLGGPLLHLSETGSTNDRARELALAGASHGSVVVAESQTAGRGRQGRNWVAPPGAALTLSAVLRLEPSELQQLPLSAALATCEACEAVCGVETQVKWPNDIWIGGLKTAGILIEARPQAGWAVLGIGLNVNTREHEFPEELRETATSLRVALGEEVSRERVLDALLERLAARVCDRSEAVLDDYRRRDALVGRSVRWKGGAGTAGGIDEQGNLVVFTESGYRVTLDAGEVHLE